MLHYLSPSFRAALAQPRLLQVSAPRDVTQALQTQIDSHCAAVSSMLQVSLSESL